MTQKEIEDRIAWIADTSSLNAFESIRMKIFGNRITNEMIAAERERIKKIIESETEWPSDELIKLIDSL